MNNSRHNKNANRQTDIPTFIREKIMFCPLPYEASNIRYWLLPKLRSSKNCIRTSPSVFSLGLSSLVFKSCILLSIMCFLFHVILLPVPIHFSCHVSVVCCLIEKLSFLIGSCLFVLLSPIHRGLVINHPPPPHSHFWISRGYVAHIAIWPNTQNTIKTLQLHSSRKMDKKLKVKILFFMFHVRTFFIV